MALFQKSREEVLRRELAVVEKQERRLEKAALKERPAAWKTELERRIPPKVYSGLESAFTKGFSLVFQQGKAIIEKTYNKTEIQNDHAIRDFAVQLKGGKKELRQMHKSARSSDLRNLAVTTVEGIGLGALGIGMPDVALFLSTLLKGIYETALNYGFDYESTGEQLLILKMMEAALSTGEDRTILSCQVDGLLACENAIVTPEERDAQIRQTASVFAMDMLLLKFIQGMPLVGILGGASNPVYYRKVMNYVQLKYRKRYLLKQVR